MTNISKHELDARALDWIRESLSVNTGLSGALLENVPLDHGEVWAYAPENVDSQKLYDFSSGGLIKNGIGGAKKIYKGDAFYSVKAKGSCGSLLTLYVKGLFEGKVIKTCIFEDVMARPSDPDIVGRLSESAFSIGEEVYHAISGDSFRLEKVREIVTAVNESWHFLCAGFGRDFDPKKASFREFKKLALDLKVLVVGAYDGESFLVWENKNCYVAG